MVSGGTMPSEAKPSVLAPGALMILLHIACAPPGEPFVGNCSGQYVSEVLRSLLDWGLVECDVGGVKSLSPRGRAYVHMLCTTPLPVHQWVDPREPYHA